MKFLLLLVVAQASAFELKLPYISVYDSNSDKTKVWILVEDCAIEVRKAKIKDVDYLIREIDKVCPELSK